MVSKVLGETWGWGEDEEEESTREIFWADDDGRLSVGFDGGDESGEPIASTEDI